MPIHPNLDSAVNIVLLCPCLVPYLYIDLSSIHHQSTFYFLIHFKAIADISMLPK